MAGPIFDRNEWVDIIRLMSNSKDPYIINDDILMIEILREFKFVYMNDSTVGQFHQNTRHLIVFIL